MYKACRWFSVATLCALTGMLDWLIGLAVWKPLDELVYTVKSKRRKSSVTHTALPRLQGAQVQENQVMTV